MFLVLAHLVVLGDRMTGKLLNFFQGEPYIPLSKVLWGALSFLLAMVVGIVILCIFPQIATWLPDQVMGAVQ